MGNRYWARLVDWFFGGDFEDKNPPYRIKYDYSDKEASIFIFHRSGGLIARSEKIIINESKEEAYELLCERIIEMIMDSGIKTAIDKKEIIRDLPVKPN